MRPSASARSFSARSRPLSRPVSRTSETPLARASGSSPATCWRARISVGAIITPCPPASTATSSARKATSVLPEPTSPLQQPVHPLRRAQVGGNLGHRTGLGGRGRVRQAVQHPPLQHTRAMAGPPLATAHDTAGKRQRQLVGEKLVIGQALAGGMGEGQPCRALRRMGLGQRAVPVGPALARLQRAVDPFGQVRQPRKRGRHGAGDHPLGQPRDQRIDRS